MERLLLWFLEGLAEVRQPAGTAGGLRPEYRPLAGTLRGCTAEARTSDICDLQEFERAR